MQLPWETIQSNAVAFSKRWKKKSGKEHQQAQNAERVTVLANRYEQTLSVLEEDVATLESKVKSHLERMGFAWQSKKICFTLM